MWRITATVLLTTVVFLVALTGVLPGATEAVHVQDDVIFVGAPDPNDSSADSGNVWCPLVGPDMRPALVFIEERAFGGHPFQHLYVKCFHAEGLQRQEITSATYLQVTQLDHATFLVSTSGGSTDRGVFVIDFDRGMGRELARSTRVSCLRSVPEQGKAMLVHCHLGIGEIRYFELDLATQRLTLRYTFKQTDLGDKFVGISPGTTLSPDFQQVACMTANSRPAQFRLTLIDLATLEQSILDDQVDIVFSPISSDLSGGPPLDWISPEQIVYRHMPMPDMNDPNLLTQFKALCVFKRANIVTGEIVEISQEKLRLSVGAGSLALNPLNGELLYNGQSVLDPNDGTLTPAILPYSVVNEYQPKRAKVFLGERLLQAADGTITSTLVSPLHRHLAYTLHRDDTEPSHAMYGKVADINEPVKVAEGIASTVPAGWIE